MNASKNIIAAFSEEQTARLTGVTVSQLRYWDRTSFYRPMYSGDNRRSSYSRIYSFIDIASLRVLNVLRNQYDVALQHLRDVSDKLNHLSEERWTGVRLYVLNKRVVWNDPNTALPQDIVSKQYVVPTMLLETIISDTRRDIAKLNVRDKTKLGQIERSRFISHNAPVISGTRITVAAIKSFANAGYSIPRILKEYPDLTKKDIEAALTFSNERIAA